MLLAATTALQVSNAMLSSCSLLTQGGTITHMPAALNGARRRGCPTMEANQVGSTMSSVSIGRRAALFAGLPAAVAFVQAAHADVSLGEIEYSELTARLVTCRELGECDIVKVEFASVSGETGIAVTKTGERLQIKSIPRDIPSNDSSPLRLVAKLRDAKVPYTFPFSDLSRFRTPPAAPAASN
eukprot:1847007-Pleurochrysis_carterae.AAC.7